MERAYTWFDLAKDYWFFLEGQRKRFIFFSLLKSATDFVPFGIAYCLGRIVDFFTKYNQGESLTEFYVLVSLIALAGSLQVYLRFYAKLRMYKIAGISRKNMRVLAMQKLMDAEMQWHEKEETGSKIEKINKGAESIYTGTQQFANEGITVLTSLFGALILFIVLEPKYVLFALCYVFIYIFGEWFFNRGITKQELVLHKMKEKVSGKIHESVSNILTIKSLGLKEAFKTRTMGYETQYYDIWLKSKKMAQLKAKTIKIWSALGYAAFILFLGYDTIAGVITVGSILVYASYFGKLRDGLHEITDNITDFITTKTGIRRFMTIVGLKSVEDGHLPSVSSSWKEIHFENVSFQYREEPALRNITIKIQKNEKIGIVGKTGCGKSTLIKLLLGLYQPKKGSIKIGDEVLSQYNHKSLTQKISVVLQDTELFNLSLAENIMLGKNDRKKLEKVIKIAQLEEVVKKLPEGTNTLVGEKGYKLSGGERQRLGIARALYKDAPVLILDEATSHLDSRTESLLQKELEKLDKTLIVIAHRLSTLKNVDRIIVMDKGKISEEGTFEELRTKNGLFAELYRLQQKK